MTDIVLQLDGIWGHDVPEALPDIVADLPAGTLFTETDVLGRKHRMLKAFHGQVIIDNGDVARGFNYGDSFDDGYSIDVTHVQIPAPDEATLERAGQAILAIGFADNTLTVAEQVQIAWWNPAVRNRALDQARAVYTALLGSADA